MQHINRGDKPVHIEEDLNPKLSNNLDMQTHKLVGEGGSDGVYVDNVGNVGIGTVSPEEKLHVSKNGCALMLGDGANVDVYMKAAGSRTQFGYDATKNALTFQAGTAKGINFNVNTSTFGDGTVMAIDINGNVGIGTTDPGNPLAVNRSADGIIVDFESADIVEGNVSIADNTTSYNAFVGSHYTQLKEVQEELPIGAVVISTGEIIPCEAEVETIEYQVIPEKDAFDTIEIPVVNAVDEYTIIKYYTEGCVVKNKKIIMPAVEAQPARIEKLLKADCNLDEDTGKIYKKIKTSLPKDVSGKEYFTYIDTTNKPADKRVYGVWNSKLSDNTSGMSFGQDDNPVYLISQVGLFKIRVTDSNGDIENGDYLESSLRPMESQKQTSQQKLNSTIAKAMIDVDWSKEKVDQKFGYKWKLIPCAF